MNYQNLIEQNIGTVYQAGIATKILQHMDRIRNVSDVSQARRWVMELFQNSRDAAYEDQPVKIRIERREDLLSFFHNGRPFRVKDILSIINQVSSKNPGENTIGQFGTGFMTTYQLSEEVEIQAVLKEEGLPYKPFSIRMDRRGTTKEEILAGIFETMEELKKADFSETMENFDKNDYHTCFRYHLDHEESRRIAKIGMTDLEETILYVLLFSERIASVELIDSTHRLVYERGEEEELGHGLRRLCVFRSEDKEENITRKPHYLIWLAEEDLILASGWNEHGMVKLSERLPRLFVDFPLIGAENFPFPVVINCRNFRTNEPRSGITLVDNPFSKDALVNKELMDRSVILYGRFLHGLAELGYERLDHVTGIPVRRPDREMSEEWVKTHLYDKLYQLVSREAMIRTQNGMISFENQEFYLLSGTDEAEVERVSDLLDRLISQRGDENLEIRTSLLHQEFDDEGLRELEDYDQSRLQNHIAIRTNRKYYVRNFACYQKTYEDAWKRSWLLLVSCGEDEVLYDLCKVVYQKELPPRQPLKDSCYRRNGMWKNADYWILSETLQSVGSKGNLEQLCRDMFPGQPVGTAYEWLNGIYQKALLYMGEADVKYVSAFPNQNGEFLPPCHLKRDEVAEEELKEIAREFQDMEPECNVYQYLLDRNVCLEPGYGLPVLREDEVAMRIHRVVQQILSERNLSDAAYGHQEACTRLLGWIQEHLQQAEKYFPGFWKEEEQMKLLTPRAAVRIQRKAQDCQKILDELGAGTMEEAMRKLTEYKEENEKMKQKTTGVSENEEKEYSGILWDGMSWDEELEAEFDDVPDDRKEEILREIGTAGEKYVLRQVKKYFEKQGYEKIRETDEEILLQKTEPSTENQIKIYYPDGGRYHQAGWDIHVSVTEMGEISNYYLEVKTHTRKSIMRGAIFLSREQIKAAARNREQYVLLSVICDYGCEEGKEIRVFADPVGQIGKGVFASRQKQYVFFVEENGYLPQSLM